MALAIEDYALIGDTCTAALVGRDGSIDWFCLPRFDSPACFAALLGDAENGRWSIAPEEEVRSTKRSYRDGTLVLETQFETASGCVTLIDFLPIAEPRNETDLCRLVRGERGSVRMRTELVVRFDYGAVVPWVRRRDYGLSLVAGPDALQLRTPVELHGENFRTCGSFTVSAGETVPFKMIWYPSHEPEPPERAPEPLLEETEQWWRKWLGQCTYSGPWADQVRRSLVTLKALTYGPTGGIVAAATTSLPEQVGGPRNWDYRYCWLRDSTFMLYALLNSGFTAEAIAWRDWLLRAVAGKPSQLQIMYGLAGERRLDESEIPWLGGYQGARPVRVGNDAYQQRQLDAYGEVLDTFHLNRKHHIETSDDAQELQKVLLDALESEWTKPDNGIWEVRGPQRHFTHSKMMAWVAADRAVRSVEQFGLEGDVERWRALRGRIHREVCERGYDAERNTFVQYYGGRETDASLLMMLLVGFLPATDPRMVGTVEAIQRELMVDGLVLRYATESGVDGLPPGEGTFLPCSFWLADCLAMIGRGGQARQIFERLLALCNDVGLLAEEYDVKDGRQLGNFPQAMSHMALVNTAHNLATACGPAKRRSEG